MSLDEDVFNHFRESPGLENVAGPWLDEIPADKRDSYPQCVAKIMPTSGQVTGALTGERFEKFDIRFETFTRSENGTSAKSQADEISLAVKAAFSGRRFNLQAGYFLGTCRQTARFVRYAGRDNTAPVWQAVNVYRLEIQDP